MDQAQISLEPRASGFRVSCDAGNTGKFQAETDSLCVRVAQRIRRRSNGRFQLLNRMIV
jgi:hypothetical protein